MQWLVDVSNVMNEEPEVERISQLPGHSIRLRVVTLQVLVHVVNRPGYVEQLGKNCRVETPFKVRDVSVMPRRLIVPSDLFNVIWEDGALHKAVVKLMLSEWSQSFEYHFSFFESLLIVLFQVIIGNSSGNHVSVVPPSACRATQSKEYCGFHIYI